MKIRSVFSSLILLVTTLTSLSACAAQNEDSDKGKSKENVLVIFFDDMRFDTFSYRNGPVNTPNIDALANEGTRFDNAMTTTGLCSPSRAALFTGRWGHKNGLDDNVWLYHSRLSELDPNQDDILQSAVDEGYYVGYVGKWHLGGQGTKLRGVQYTWGKEHKLERHLRQWTPYGIVKSVEGYKQGKLDANGEKHMYYQTQEGTYADTTTAQKVKAGQEFLEKAAKDDRPFFGVISFEQPHPPYRVPEPYASMFDPNKVKLPSNHAINRKNKPRAQDEDWWPWHDVSHMTDEDWRKSRSFYYGAIAMIDRAVGDIIKTTKDLGLYDDLNIVILGDQGSMLGEHSLYDKGPYAYDELMKMPLIMKTPSNEPKIINKQVSMLDITPTLADWMGVEDKSNMDGFSLVPMIEKGDQAYPREEDVAMYAYEWYNGSWFGIRAIRTPEMKLVWNPGDSRDELYDLVNDPTEENNLINNPKYRKQVIDMFALLRKELVRVDDPSVTKLDYHAAHYAKKGNFNHVPE